MKTDKIAQKLADILPDRPVVPGMSNPDTSKLVEQEATRIKSKQDAKELARIKYLEKSRLRSLKEKQEKRQSLAEELGVEEIPDGQTELQAKRIVEQQKRVEAIEALEAQTVEPLKATELAERHDSGRGSYSSAIRSALQLQGASRPEITKLLTSLNINLSVQLTKQDTANLLACLLTCNHSQLQALMANKKVPVVIKTVIKRLIEDEKLGNIETIEKLWDRIFGKGPMQLSLPEGQQLQTGIIPNQPVSREAYILIRDTLIK
nr:MAG TPA: hypothetical protein [Caudoviricetes sp.]